MVPQDDVQRQYAPGQQELTGYLNEEKPPGVLLFVHLPRTAGTTLNGILGRQYVGDAFLKLPDGFAMRNDQIVVGSDPLVGLSSERLGRLRAISGHMSIGLDRRLSRPARYLTVLRDPVARVVSLYQYIRANPRHRFHAQIVGENLTLKECLTRPFVQFNNGQLRMLTGTISRHLLGHGVDDAELLAQAKRTLDRQCDLVGTTSRFDEFLVLAWQRYRWQVPLYRRNNVSPATLSTPELDLETRALAEQQNVMDRELYRYADERLTYAVQVAGPQFQRQARLFSMLNAAGGRT